MAILSYHDMELEQFRLESDEVENIKFISYLVNNFNYYYLTYILS